MGMKFLNKKGWHTGSLRNIENVWKAEQKHAAEEKKLDELRKQIVEERERSEFRELQEQAGLVPKQERLEFLYDSGLAVGRPGGSDSLKEAFTKAEEPSSSAAAAAKEASASAPGALFAAEKPQSANDAWRKLHSDPLLMIKQREQEALARIKNNPVQMAMIRKQVETKKPKDKERDKKEHRKKHRKESSKHQKQTSDSEDDTADMERRKNSQRKASKYVKHSELEDEPHEIAHRSEKNRVKQSNVEDESRHRARESGKTQAKYSDSEDELRNKERGRGNHVRHSDWEDASHNRAHRSEKKYSDELNNRGHRSEKNRIKHADSEDKLHNTGRSENNRGKRSDVEDVLHNRRSRSEKNRGKHSDSEDELHNRRSRSEKNPGKHSDSEDELHNQRSRSEKNGVKHLDSDDGLHKRAPSIENNHAIERAKDDGQGMVKGKHESSEQANSSIRGQNDTHNRRRFVPPKLSEEERAARLKEMQIDAEFHEEQRWKRLKKADEKDAREATQAIRSGGKNFLDAVQTSVYGSGKGGSSTIEESVRRRTHYSQGRSEAGESNAFRR
uniref:pre-mRNA-splicing factor CWC25 homolog isoform X2 n=1 Tax=Fragaria vesca subsp. vesca TaxID=101020 RepID=UPI0005C87006|nr:PREDICTED: pre-mRNA-splicing factor CWC25 homolog isoform X2 [Fragaria vesca subsp. vesca]